MEKCLYFAKKLKNLNEADALAPGFGFTAKGDWRGRPLPSDEIGLIVDDCFLPKKTGSLQRQPAVDGTCQEGQNC